MLGISKAFSNWSRIIDFGNGAGSNNVLLAYTVGTSGSPGLHIAGTQIQSTSTLPLNQWSHVAATFSGGTGTIYVNGIAAGSGSFPTPANVTRTLNYVGRSNWGEGGDPDANAVYDELRIWNVARTQSEIQSAMSFELTGSESGLQVYFPFNQGVACGDNTSITEILDMASAGGTTNATLHDFTLSGGCSSNFTNSMEGILVTNDAPSVYPLGNTTVTWTATDAAGNTATCTQDVTVVDNQVPTLASPGNQTLTTISNTCAATYTIADPISDNCTGSFWGYSTTGATTLSSSGNTIAYGTGSGVLSFNVGATAVTLTGIDAVSNIATSTTFTVTVTDNEAPVISCPQDLTVNANYAGCTYNGSIGLASVTDNCSATVSGPIPAGPYSVGTTTVVWTATDASGNTSTCSQIITVLASPTASSSSVSTLGCYVWNVNNTTYSVSGVYTASFINAIGCDSIVTLNLTITPGIFVAAKAILAGPYNVNTGLMHDSLRVKQLIPATEPYSSAPYNKTSVGGPGGETVSPAVLEVIGDHAIVDWVMLEIRNAVTPSTVIANKRALLQRDGDIVSAADGVSPVFFANQPQGNYIVSVKHRNHLGVMTASAVSLSPCTITNVDFTTSSPVYTNPSITTAPRKTIGSVRALWSADANNNKNVKYTGLSNDKDFIAAVYNFVNLNNTYEPVYRREDVNMDGKIRFNNTDNDRAPIIENVGPTTPNAIINQHTPN
ncbi:hypothetical protein EMGBS15_18780 [Filimonas sp.]|nr:hypothetical protein EMGBS15_18780 [Filimonas sp.]